MHDMANRSVVTASVLAVVGFAFFLQPVAAKPAVTSTVKVTIGDTKLDLRPARVQPGRVVFKITDTGNQAHTFAIAGRSTRTLQHGASAILTVSFVSGGSFKAIARTSSGRTLSAGLKVGSPTPTILPATTTSPSKTSTSTTPSTSSGCSQPVSTTVTVTIVPPKFNFSRTTIPCGSVTFVVTNTGQLTHSLQITAPAGAATIPANPPIQPGQTQTFTATMTAKGIYAWQCGEREDNSDDGEYGNLAVQ